MKLNEYKNAMNGIEASESLKQSIITKCESGCEPRALPQKRKASPAVRRILLVAAVLAVMAAVITSWVLIVRFIGPQGDTDTGTETSAEGGNANSLPAGIVPLSVSSGLDKVSAEILSYDAETKTVSVRWKNDTDNELGFGKAFVPYKLVDGEWSTEWHSIEGEGVAFEDIAILLPAKGTADISYSLSRWSNNITAGTYKIEADFFGDGNIYKMKIEFRLDASRINNVLLLSSDCKNEDLRITLGGYNTATGMLEVNYITGETGLTVGREHSFYKLIDGEWTQECFENRENIVWTLEALLYNPSSTHTLRYPLGSWSENITVGDYKLETNEITVEFRILSLTSSNDGEPQNNTNQKSVSSDSGIATVTINTANYNAETMSLGIEMSNTGNSVTYTNSYRLYKQIDGNWTQECFEKRYEAEGTSTIYGGTSSLTGYDLSQWSDNITDGTYKWETEIYDENNVSHTAYVIFELNLLS